MPKKKTKKSSKKQNGVGLRKKSLCDLKPRSKFCKKEDKKVKPYTGGKLNIDEICHNCTENFYAKSARKFCKSHGKVWNPKTNSCKDKKKKTYKKKRSQKGGFVPCLPCAGSVLSGLGIFGAGTAAAGTALAVSTRSSSKNQIVNGKIKRKEDFESQEKKDGKSKKIKYSISQDDKKVIYKEGKKTIKKKFKTAKKAGEYYNKMKNKCKKKCKK